MTQASTAELLECALRGPDDPKWVASWAAELDRRVKELDASTVKTIHWEQIKSEMLQRLLSR